MGAAEGACRGGGGDAWWRGWGNFCRGWVLGEEEEVEDEDEEEGGEEEEGGGMWEGGR